ncbi:hypothetical protein JHK82_018028 [Glycine max]|uniref:Uncharacterized protein n=2 Tax=Glycine subgen. Soja TaxID=1462606 RepID=A0A0R0J946_SOYBN|nr:hypothetical protein JHK85_018500 [Glycine max]RZC02245.1 hypothetical protein D0Y65_017407 [Glycine soja]KAG5037259.1 hypothetical protein JHK86_018099 [Glycine max]KAG5142333.1 hypothetical protein JHK82_018028 [Glycine max]KAH1086182.1 hypothetical protein GYH30_017926 [Glycine max]
MYGSKMGITYCRAYTLQDFPSEYTPQLFSDSQRWPLYQSMDNVRMHYKGIRLLIPDFM